MKNTDPARPDGINAFREATKERADATVAAVKALSENNQSILKLLEKWEKEPPIDEPDESSEVEFPDKIYVNEVYVDENEYYWNFPPDDDTGVGYIRKDLYDKLRDAAKQVIDEIEPHGHWHCLDALKKALEAQDG